MSNVILITLDACRKDVFGCYGNREGLTPFMDSLGSRCTKFNNAQAIGPYTQASFPGILTSSYFMEYGWQQRCPAQRVFVSEVLRKSGIATAAFHSNPYLCGYFGWNRGWDVFMDSMKEKVTPEVPFLKGDRINRFAEEWLIGRKARRSSQPFFLWVHYMDVHEPYVPQRKYVDLVDPSIDLTEEQMMDLFKEVLLKRDTSNPSQVKLLRALYNAHVREVDGYVKDLFYLLERLELLTDSKVIITSDHGDEFNEHGGLSHDDKMYRELIDVPLLIYDAAKEKSEEFGHVVSNIDIPPTIVHLFEIEPVNAFEGQSLLPMDSYSMGRCFGEALFQIKGKGGDLDKDIYYYREEDLKIIYRRNVDAWELYDLNADPQELQNIVEMSSKAEAMKSKLRPRVRRWERIQ